MDPLLIMFMYEMNSFERPISQPLKVRNELGHWIFIVRYWIFSSKLLNLTAMTITLLTKIPVPASRISLFFDFLEKLFGQAILMHSLITSSSVDNL